jgi:hypothetical protein
LKASLADRLLLTSRFRVSRRPAQAIDGRRPHRWRFRRSFPWTAGMRRSPRDRTLGKYGRDPAGLSRRPTTGANAAGLPVVASDVVPRPSGVVVSDGRCRKTVRGTARGSGLIGSAVTRFDDSTWEPSDAGPFRRATSCQTTVGSPAMPRIGTHLRRCSCAPSVVRQAVLRSSRVDGWNRHLPISSTRSILDRLRLQGKAKRDRERAERNYPRIPGQPGRRDCVDAEEG